jgi:hypothetical protein
MRAWISRVTVRVLLPVLLLTACDRFFSVDGIVRTAPKGPVENASLTIERFDAGGRLLRTDTLRVLSDGQFGGLTVWLRQAQSARLRVRLTGYRTVTLYAPAESLSVGSWQTHIVLHQVDTVAADTVQSNSRR